MIDYKKAESIFVKHECTDFRWIDPREIVTSQWVRTKCTYGCGNFGRHACCPPNVLSVSECRQFINDYTKGVIFHFSKAAERPDVRLEWGRKTYQDLLNVEREIFLLGYHKTFMLPAGTCNICDKCTGARDHCKNPKLARPTPEGMTIDVYTTARKFSFPIQVLTDFSQVMNKYGFLLIE